jgi:hypothetical protein
MLAKRTALLNVVVPALLAVTGCGSSDEALPVASKKECIPEVARRLVACNGEAECEKGIVRFAGYCYNTAAGTQLDICRGGAYFFEQPMAELERGEPELFGKLGERLEEVLVRTGDTFCVYNSSR